MELDRNRRESSYVNILLSTQKQHMSRSGRMVLDDEEKFQREVPNYKLRRINNILEADKEGAVPKVALRPKDMTMDDIHMKKVYYDYLIDNNFILFTFISIDILCQKID